MQKDAIHWAVASKIPANRGLKSSAATSVAAIKALCEATQTTLGDAEIVSLSSQAQVLLEFLSQGRLMTRGPV